MTSASGLFAPGSFMAVVRQALLAVLLALFFAPAAHADVCGMLQAQIDSARRSTPAVGQLKRQYDALSRLERQQQCSRRSGIFTLFSSCGDISRRKSALVRQMRSASGDGGTAGLRARMVSLGCAARGARPQMDARARTPNADTRYEAGWVSGNDMLFCVRLDDGYFFPAPNSGFVRASDVKLIESQCRYICDDAKMAVYRLDDPSLETEEMVSVESRQPYTDLSTAFRYRDAEKFKTCNLQRYSQRVNLARAESITPRTVDANSVVLPVPNARPDIEPMAFTENQQSALDANPLTRKVRVVGDPYLPNE